MAITKIPAAGFSDAVNFRNIIINGDMSISQRSTSVASISSGNTIHTCDRWKTYASSAGTWTQTQEALTSGDAYNDGFSNSLKLDCTTANGSLSSGSYLMVAQSIEAQNLQYIKKGTSEAEQLTVSFWVKSTKTGTNIVQFVNLDNTVRICAKSYTINSSDTWEKKTLTIPADTSSTGKIANDNGEGLRMIFWIAAGTNFTSGTLATTWQNTNNPDRAVGQVNNADSTSNNFEITGVQLETGTSASDFEFLPVDVNLKRCQRYYETNFIFFGIVCSDTTARAIGHCRFMTPKRANPTVGQVSGSSADIDFAFAGNSSFNTSFESSSTEGFRVYGDSLSPTRTIGTNGYWKHSNASIKADSEI
jgi:hypothetical protein